MGGWVGRAGGRAGWVGGWLRGQGVPDVWPSCCCLKKISQAQARTLSLSPPLTPCPLPPCWLPCLQAETTLINFTVTERGLEDQLLALVLNKERADLEEAKGALIVQNSGTLRLLWSCCARARAVLCYAFPCWPRCAALCCGVPCFPLQSSVQCRCACAATVGTRAACQPAKLLGAPCTLSSMACMPVLLQSL